MLRLRSSPRFAAGLPAIARRAAWARSAGRNRLLPDGWTITVELRGDTLYGGRGPRNLAPLVPVAPDVFVVSGRLGEWIFVGTPGRPPERIVDLRQFETLVGTRVEGE